MKTDESPLIYGESLYACYKRVHGTVMYTSSGAIRSLKYNILISYERRHKSMVDKRIISMCCIK